MRDYLAWRMAFGVTTPSTNTVVQPEYDDMRPEGVTNHIARMVIADNPVHTDADFAKQIEDIDAALEDAVDRVMDAKPNAFILGISALSVWGGNVERGAEAARAQGGWLGRARDIIFGRRRRRAQGPRRETQDCGDGALLSLHRTPPQGRIGRAWLRNRSLLPHAREEPGILLGALSQRHD